MVVLRKKLLQLLIWLLYLKNFSEGGTWMNESFKGKVLSIPHVYRLFLLSTYWKGDRGVRITQLV
jgi:hypothetical protein